MYCRKPLAGFRKGKGNNPISFCKALSCGCGIGITAAQNRMRRSITKVKTNKHLKEEQCRHEKRTQKDKTLGFYLNGANWTFKNAHFLCITQTYYRHSTLRALEQYGYPTPGAELPQPMPEVSGVATGFGLGLFSSE